ncbi:ArsR/SmtB family transcription factor [Magnetococcus sp. PR-3]|uniref:ArsR/SmtB family transcription factor n=1 Tax=Magnetococcus sp. PR-3 TaxID=3120355 RepID=UPI003FA58B49
METNKPYKTQIFDQLARVGKALANGHRLELLEFLAQGERTVDALAGVSKLSVANTSQHLQVLRQAGLVDNRKEGQKVYYRLSDTRVIALISLIQALAEDHLAEMDRLIAAYLTSRDAMEPMPVDELLVRAREGSVTVLDVRPPEEYAAGHLPGAINIPLKELEARLAQLPSGQEVVAYCRGPYCVLSFETVAILRAKGIKARRLQDGMPEWRLAGLPVEGANPSDDPVH